MSCTVAAAHHCRPVILSRRSMPKLSRRVRFLYTSLVLLSYSCPPFGIRFLYLVDAPVQVQRRAQRLAQEIWTQLRDGRPAALPYHSLHSAFNINILIAYSLHTHYIPITY